MSKKALFLAPFGAGVFILIQVIMPVVSFKYWELTSYSQNLTLISPDTSHQVLGVSVDNANEFPAITSSNYRQSALPYQQFSLSIPSLKLDNLKVVVETNNFDNNLAHLPGASLPGEKGNVFITGHSALPQLFKPTNFKAIFANLPNIKKGDEIVVDAGEQRYVYVVQGLKIIDPAEISVINPPDYIGRYLSLMTCVPPGLYLKRLVVLAELR